MNATPVSTPAKRQTNQARAIGSTGFSIGLAGSPVDGQVRVERAEAMVGERIRAPEGGCGCDALVGQATAIPATRDLTTEQPPIAVLPFAREAQRTPAVDPGDIIEIAPPRQNETPLTPGEVDPTEHVHMAIVRNATEMIGVDSNGVVCVMAIPWSRVTRR